MASIAQRPSVISSAEGEAADAYDAAGTLYRTYADGDIRRLFDFSSRYSFADREIWQRIDTALVDRRTGGSTTLKVLDAGCGPGTWLIRVVLRAQALGYETIVATGFDVSPAMVELASAAALEFIAPEIRPTFAVQDIEDGLCKHACAPADLVLCLYGVVNHLPIQRHAAVAAALAGATAGSLLVTARTIGSLPSIFVAGVEEARDFQHDHRHDRLSVDLKDGRHIEFSSHLFSAAEFSALFAGHGAIAEMLGLDLFHGRFTPDRRWNPPLAPNRAFDDALVRLEHLCASDPWFMDRAAHVLLHMRGTGERL